MKSLTNTASNVALAAGGLVGFAGLAGAQTTTNGTIVSYTGSAVTALAAANNVDIIFNVATGAVTTGTSDNKGNATSFDLEARTTGNENFLSDTESSGSAGGQELVVGGSANHLAPDLAAGTVIGTQAGTGSPTTAGANFFFTGKNYVALNAAGDTTSQFPDNTSNVGTTTSTTGYLGFEVAAGSGFDYGWAEVTVDPVGDITLDGFAYDTSGATIAAGVIAPVASSPEPTTAGMVLLGGAALALLARRSRKESLTA